jgi:hypothetical protein
MRSCMIIVNYVIESVYVSYNTVIYYNFPSYWISSFKSHRFLALV